MNVRLILRERLSIERSAEVVREPDSLTTTDDRALLTSLQVPLPQGTSSVLSASAPQRNETEPTKDWYESAGRGLPSLVANPLLQLVTAQAEMKSRDLATIVPSCCKSLTGRITRSLIDGARKKVVVPCSELYKIVACFSRSLQGRIRPSLIYGARQKGSAASLVLIIISTAVIGTISGVALGLIKARSNVTSSLRTGTQSVPLNVSLPPAPIAPASSIASPANSHDNKKSQVESQVTANVRATRANAQPSTVHLNLDAPRGDEKVTLRSPLKVKVVEEKPAPNPPHRPIAVVVQIEEGRVKKAYIQNPQASLRAFESTALRLARDRRYPKETRRKETVILHISNQPQP